jgi:hypothetical protein
LAPSLKLNAVAAIFIPVYGGQGIDSGARSNKNNPYTISVRYNLKWKKVNPQSRVNAVGNKKSLQ